MSLSTKPLTWRFREIISTFSEKEEKEMEENLDFFRNDKTYRRFFWRKQSQETFLFRRTKVSEFQELLSSISQVQKSVIFVFLCYIFAINYEASFTVSFRTPCSMFQIKSSLKEYGTIFVYLSDTFHLLSDVLWVLLPKFQEMFLGNFVEIAELLSGAKTKS